MKNLLVFFFWVCTLWGYGQQDLSLYHLSGVPQANLVNPGVIPESKLVIGIPALSSVNANYNNYAFSINDGFEFEGTTLIVDPELLLSKLKTNNHIYNQVQDQWLLVGVAHEKNYFQIGLSDKVILDLSIPKTLVELAVRGNAGVLGKDVSIGNLSAYGTHYRELSLGYARKLKRWDLGIHGNLLVGLANVYTRSSTLSVFTDPETYDITIDGALEINTSGLDNIDDFGNYITSLRNFGFGVDVGAVFRPNEQMEFSSSVIDLGMIFWKQDVETYTTNGKSFTLNGLDIKEYADGGDIDLDSLLTEIQDSLENVFSLDTLYDNYNTPLIPKWYIGGKYIFNEKHRVFGTVNLQFFNTGIRPAFSVGYEFRLERNLGLVVNYSYFSGSFTNIGFGIQVRGGPLQFYVMTDSVLSAFNFLNYQTIHYRFGINLLFGDPDPRYRPTYFR